MTSENTKEQAIISMAEEMKKAMLLQELSMYIRNTQLGLQIFFNDPSLLESEMAKKILKKIESSQTPEDYDLLSFAEEAVEKYRSKGLF